MRRGAWLGVVVVATCLTSAVCARDVALKYKRFDDPVSTPFSIARVQIAGHDLQARGAAPAEMEIDFTTSNSRGLQMMSEKYTSITKVGGRQCLACNRLQGAGFVIQDDRFLETTRTVYLQLDYYDKATTGSVIRVGYDAMRYGQYRDAETSESQPVGLSGTWKTAQFRLEDASFGDRSHGPVDLTVLLEREQRLGAWSMQSTSRKSGRPPADCKLPELADKKPTWFTLSVGGKERVGVLDAISTESDIPRYLIFDSNGNNDLTDDPRLEGTSQEAGTGFWFGQFPASDLVIEEDGIRRPYSLRWSAYSMNLPFLGKDTQLIASANCCYTGEFELDGTRYLVALTDSNCDGRFDENNLYSPATPPDLALATGLTSATESTSASEELGSGDTFTITDRDDLGAESAVVFRLGTDLTIRDKYFAVGVDIAHGLLHLEESTVTMGSLRLTAQPQDIKLHSDDGKHSVMVFKPTQRLTLPEGTYRFSGYTMTRDDEQGDGWRLSARSTEDTSGVVVAKGLNATLHLGEPFRPVVSVAQWDGKPMITTEGSFLAFWKPKRKQALLNFTIYGAGGETVSNIEHYRGQNTKLALCATNSKVPKEPTYKILKPDGEIAGQGKFAYG